MSRSSLKFFGIIQIVLVFMSEAMFLLYNKDSTRQIFRIRVPILEIVTQQFFFLASRTLWRSRSTIKYKDFSPFYFIDVRVKSFNDEVPRLQTNVTLNLCFVKNKILFPACWRSCIKLLMKRKRRVVE